MRKNALSPVEIPATLLDDEQLKSLIAAFKKCQGMELRVELKKIEEDRFLSSAQKKTLKKELRESQFKEMSQNIARFLRSYKENSLVTSYGFDLVARAMEKSKRSASGKKGAETTKKRNARKKKREKQEEEKARQGVLLL